MSNGRIYPSHSIIPILKAHQMKVMTLRMLGLISDDYGRWPFLSVGATLKRNLEDFKLTPVTELIGTSKTEAADVISTYLKLAVDRDYVKLCKDYDLFEPPSVHVPIVTGKADNMDYGVVVTRVTDKVPPL